MKLASKINTFIATIGLSVSSASSAVVVDSGQFFLIFDKAALFSLDALLINKKWHDQKASADLSASDMSPPILLPDPKLPNIFIFEVFGSNINNPAHLVNRYPQASTFDTSAETEITVLSGGSFDTSEETGVIGLSGVHIIGGSFAGNLLFGDYDLSFKTDRIGITANSSGWCLTRNITTSSVAFDLTNVTTTRIDDDNFTLTGDVVLSPESSIILEPLVVCPENPELLDPPVVCPPPPPTIGSFIFTTTTANHMQNEMVLSSGNNILTLPSVKVGGGYHYYTLNQVEPNTDGDMVFELKSEGIFAGHIDTSLPQTEFDTATGIVSIPAVALISENGTYLRSLKVMMKEIENSSPPRFTVTSVEIIEE